MTVNPHAAPGDRLTQAGTLERPSAVLRADSLVKTFGRTEALRGATLEVARGEVLAIMGPSGSGKSTLLHCLAGVLVPDSGGVTFDGQEVSALDEERRSALRLRDFGFVFQFGQLLPELSAVDNITVPLLLSGMKRARAVAVAVDWLGRMELAHLGDKLPGELSGGESQRVAIARALATEPAVLFADEPTGSLDSLAAENVMNLMLGLVRSTGTTVVVITHDARTAAYADRTVIVRDGTVAGARGVHGAGAGPSSAGVLGVRAGTHP